jgi:hypothetical protein
MTSNRNNSRRVYNGRMLAYIQTTGDAGAIEITFTAPWLTSGKVTLHAD